MFMNIFINNYLKNISVEKAILVAKQFCIDFSYKEMNFVLPFIKVNWQNFLDKTKKPFLLQEIANSTTKETAKKTDALLNKFLIIIS